MTTDNTANNTASAKPTKTSGTAEAKGAGGSSTIVVDLGKKNRKQIRKLRKGKAGNLMDRVEETLAHLRENGAIAENAQAVVFVVKERRRVGGKVAKMWGLG